MNIVVLIGNLASEPELRHTPAGKAVCEFRIAVSRGKDEADFFSIVTWERQAELCAEYIAKGSKVGVEGRLLHSTWEKDGAKRSKIEVVAHRVNFLGSKRDAHEEIPATTTTDEDIPF